VRALTGIQAEGFRAASELVERFVRMATGGVNGAQSSFRQAAPLSAEQLSDLYGATDVEPLMRSWWVMVGQFLLGGASQTPTQTSTPPASLGFSDGEAKGRLDFDLPVGGTATGVGAIRTLMDDYGSIEFTGEYAEGILLVAEEYFEQAFADARPGPDLDFLRSLVPYVWARWR